MRVVVALLCRLSLGLMMLLLLVVDSLMRGTLADLAMVSSDNLSLLCLFGVAVGRARSRDGHVDRHLPRRCRPTRGDSPEGRLFGQSRYRN